MGEVANWKINKVAIQNRKIGKENLPASGRVAKKTLRKSKTSKALSKNISANVKQQGITPNLNPKENIYYMMEKEELDGVDYGQISAYSGLFDAFWSLKVKSVNEI